MELKVLDKGFIRLENHCAKDLDVVNAARVSYGKRHEQMEEGDDKLIDYLVKNNHGTPLEHTFFTFHIKAPITVAREWFRHRMSSYNEISGRYVEMKNEFYVPNKARKQEGKPGHYIFVEMDEVESNRAAFAMQTAYEYAYTTYKALLGQGVAKELARSVLPLGLYTEFYWSCNARSLIHFINLRNSPEAMYEIRQYAEGIESMFSSIMPNTYGAYQRYIRNNHNDINV